MTKKLRDIVESTRPVLVRGRTESGHYRITHKGVTMNNSGYSASFSHHAMHQMILHGKSVNDYKYHNDGWDATIETPDEMHIFPVKRYLELSKHHNFDSSTPRSNEVIE